MFRDLVLANRSYRGFDESIPVTEEQLRSFVDLARLTASSVNLQPLKYHIAYEREEVEALLSLTKWAGKLPELHLPKEGKHPTAFIVIFHDRKIAANEAPFQKDVGIAAQTILLAATEAGLGGCMIGNFRKDAVKELLGLAGTLEPQLLIGLGKPAEQIVLTELDAQASRAEEKACEKEEKEAMPSHSARSETDYYRDDADVHYVPKRRLQDVLC